MRPLNLTVRGQLTDRLNSDVVCLLHVLLEISRGGADEAVNLVLYCNTRPIADDGGVKCV